MPWSKLDDRLHENPKVGAMSDKAFRLYILSITYSSSRRSRGHLKLTDVNMVRKLAEATQAEIDELLSLRAWDIDGEGFCIHSYCKYNPDAEEISQKRSEAGKKGADSRWQNGKPIANAITTDKQTDSTGNPVPVPSPVPIPVSVPDPEPSKDLVLLEPENTNVKNSSRRGQAPTGAETGRAWEFYIRGYIERYKVQPLRNATTNAQMKAFVGRLGEEIAPLVAYWFVTEHKGAWYVKQNHSVGCLLKDAEPLHTQWQTGRRVTSREASEVDRMDATLSMMQRVSDRAIARREGKEHG